MTRLLVLVVTILAAATAGGFWSTRWIYYDETVGSGVTRKATVRVNRWTGTRQVFRCGPELSAQTQAEVRRLEARLSVIIATWPGLGLQGLVRPEQQLRVCPTCPISDDAVVKIARQPPFVRSAEVRHVLDRLQEIEREHWSCRWQ